MADKNPDRITDIAIVTDDGIVRNDKGKFLEGTKNPREAKRAVTIKNLKEIIERKTGKDCERIIQKLAMIALYDDQEPEVVKNKETGEWETRSRVIACI